MQITHETVSLWKDRSNTHLFRMQFRNCSYHLTKKKNRNFEIIEHQIMVGIRFFVLQGYLVQVLNRRQASLTKGVPDFP